MVIIVETIKIIKICNNLFLMKFQISCPPVKDLFVDLRDGHKLLALLESFTNIKYVNYQKNFDKFNSRINRFI